jgi:hypothetical protein
MRPMWQLFHKASPCNPGLVAQHSKNGRAEHINPKQVTAAPGEESVRTELVRNKMDRRVIGCSHVRAKCLVMS